MARTPVIDRGHLHNHFVVNSVSFADGKRFHRDAACYREMREASDRLCAERGLSVIEKSSLGASRHYSEWSAEKQGRPTWRALVKADVDEAIAHAATERQFWANLAALGYEVKRGKDISVRPPGKERFVRLARNFGRGLHAFCQINGRILSNRRALAPARARHRPKSAVGVPAPRGSLLAAYRRWLYLLGGVRRRTQAALTSSCVRTSAIWSASQTSRRCLPGRESRTRGQLNAYVSKTQEKIGALTNERKAIRKAAPASGAQLGASRGFAEIAEQLKRLKKGGEDVRTRRGKIEVAARSDCEGRNRSKGKGGRRPQWKRSRRRQNR